MIECNGGGNMAPGFSLYIMDLIRLTIPHV